MGVSVTFWLFSGTRLEVNSHPQLILTQTSSNDVNSRKDVPNFGWGTGHEISRMRNDDLHWTGDLEPNISKTLGDRSVFEIEARFQWGTNRKWHIDNRIVTWRMTSRDLERWRSWPQYVWGPLSRKRLEIEIRSQWNTYSKWYMWYQMVTCSLTSRDPKRSRLWPRYVCSRISRKRLEIQARFQWSTNRKLHMENRIVM